MLLIPLNFYQQMKAYANAVDGEIGGVGHVETTGEHIFITDLWLLNQEATGATFKCDKKAVAILMNDLIENGTEKTLNFLWHSHGGGSVFHSGPDNEEMLGWESTWMVSLVINKSMEMKAKLITNVPIPMVQELNTHIYYPEHPEYEEFVKEAKAKVREKVVTVTEWEPQRFGKYGYYQNRSYSKKDKASKSERQEDTKSVFEMTEEEYEAYVKEEFGDEYSHYIRNY